MQEARGLGRLGATNMKTTDARGQGADVSQDGEKTFEQKVKEHMELYRRAKTDPSVKLPVINGIENMLKFNEMTERSRAGRW